jgi:hypothetical protein
MSSLFLTNDALTQERLNRIASPVHLLNPVYDVNDSNVVTVTAKPVDGGALAASAVTTHYTVPSSGVAVAVVHRITLCNGVGDPAPNHAGVYLVENGGLQSSANVIFYGTLAIGESVQLEGPWFLDPSDSIRSYSGSFTGANVGLRCEVSEFAATPAGLAYAGRDGVLLSTSIAALYTCPGSGVRHANVEAITVCNWSVTARRIVIEIRPSGGTQQIKQYVLDATMGPGESVILGGFVLEPGDSIYGWCAAINSAAARVSVVEYATT